MQASAQPLFSRDRVQTNQWTQMGPKKDPRPAFAGRHRLLVMDGIHRICGGESASAMKLGRPPGPATANQTFGKLKHFSLLFRAGPGSFLHGADTEIRDEQARPLTRPRFDAYDVQIFVRTIWTSTVAIRMLFKMAQVWSFMLLSRSVYSLWRRVFTIAIATSGFLPQKSRQSSGDGGTLTASANLATATNVRSDARSDVSTLIDHFRH